MGGGGGRSGELSACPGTFPLCNRLSSVDGTAVSEGVSICACAGRGVDAWEAEIAMGADGCGGSWPDMG